MKIEIERPSSLQRALKVPNRNMFGPGPTNCSPRVLHAMSLPVISPLHDECYEIMDEIKDGLKYLFQTQNPYTMCVSASGNGGVEASICNLAEQGEVVMIGVNGMWGKLAADMAHRYGTKLVKLEKNLGECFYLEEVEKALIQHRPVLFFIVLGESSTGVLQPMEGLGELCHKYNCLLVIDVVVAIGAVPVFSDLWGVDVIVAGSQKAISCPPGLSPISFSPRAIEKIKQRKTPVAVRYFDALLLGNYWGCEEKQPRKYHHTSALNLYYALREGLAIIVEEGLEKMWERHRACHKLLQEGLKKMEVDFFVKDEKIRLPCVTTISSPNVDWKRVNKYILSHHQTELSNGTGPTIGLVLRIGLLGYNARPENVDYILKILKEALENEKSLQI